MREQLRQIQIRWPVVALVLILAVGSLIAILIVNNNDRNAANNRDVDTQVTESQMGQKVAELQKNVDNVGTNGYVESKARAEGMIREGELIFHVENPERLDCYTVEEWQILTSERQVYAETGGK